MPTDRDYLQAHDIPGVVDSFLAKLLAEKPEDPITYASQYFHNLGKIKPLVAGNWKSNGSKKLIADLSAEWNNAKISHEVDVFIAPSMVHQSLLKKSLIHPKFKTAAQNCTEKNGAFTGEVSAAQLKDAGVPWVILGHSERRAIYGESDEVIAGKVAAALRENLLVCPCVGETLAEREAGTTMKVVLTQLQAVASRISEHQWESVAIAYEPVWAIGTGKVATPEQAQDVHAGIRQWLRDNVGSKVATSTRILYGGSVNPKNAGDLWAQRDINGFLVGGASLKADFVEVINATAKDKPL
eukprot:Hpha_TRINITY_DN13556_c0_g1::TRINITY_DN13556_c0_g1_i1::g.111625::m.111625/K01803/TPI, tpiA; triosephosphate isomerase (TIM)